MSIDRLRDEIREFARERDWEKYHSPKNLAIGLAIEAAELMEIFLWKGDDESRDAGEVQLKQVREEIGDVAIYLLNIADKFGLDPIECAKQKLEINKLKYPATLVKGSAKKYKEYQSGSSDIES